MTTPASVLAPLQTALYVLLKADPDLGAGVYDFVDEPATHPYVVIGEAVESPDNAHDQFGRSVLVTVHVWTKARGHAEGLRIAGRLTVLLDHQPLTIAGHKHVVTRHELTQPLRDPDPQIRHVVCRFRVITEQES